MPCVVCSPFKKKKGSHFVSLPTKSLGAKWISTELGWEPGRRLGSRRLWGQRMTNECVMHRVAAGQRPVSLVCLVNTPQVNPTTKTSFSPVSRHEAVSRVDWVPRGWERGWNERCTGDGWGGSENKMIVKGCEASSEQTDKGEKYTLADWQKIIDCGIRLGH